MGIQNFFGYFFSESNLLKPNKKFIIEETVDTTVKKFYVDFVSIIHDILAENRNIDDGTDEADNLIIQKVINRLATLFNFYPNAKKLIFFECVPTVAKIKEQFSRRIFRKIQNDIEIDLKQRLKCEIIPRFDQMKFSIDSDFLKQVVIAIKENFDNNDVEVFPYSDNKIGEAEHGIIHHIANTKFENNDVFSLYSPDADCYLLSTILTNILSSSDKKLTVNTLRRSDDIPDRLFYKIDTLKYIDFLLEKIDCDKSQHDIINYITYIFNLLGDDFLFVFDKFKTSHARDIFPIIFRALKNLGTDCILEPIGENNKLVVNKHNLLRVFEELQHYENKNKNFKRTYRYILPLGEQVQHNKLVFMVLQDAFQKGYYFYEKASKSNHNNFSVTKLNYNKKFTNTTSKFLVYNLNAEKKQYEITISKSYKTVPMLEIDKKKSDESIESDEMILNYFEGFEFILDLYYNTIGTVKNNFWYYRYNKSPSIASTINWLQTNDMPSYEKQDNPTRYFTGTQYKKFLQKLIDVNYSKILGTNKLISYDSLVIAGEHPINKIFDCFEKKYINKCEIKNEQFFDPIEFVKKHVGGDFYKKYKKYKKKYRMLKKSNE